MSGHVFACLLLVCILSVQTDGYCLDDNDCLYGWNHQCYNNTVRSYCRQGSCQQDADCGFDLLFCQHGYCRPSYCATDEDCQADNAACFYGVCFCKPGFRRIEKACVSVTGLTCRPYSADLDCNPSSFELMWNYGSVQNYGFDYVCDKQANICQCNMDVKKQNNGVCYSYLGSECKSSLECGRNSNMSCIDGTCTCSTGFLLRESECIWVMDAGCSSTDECLYEGFECKNTDIGSFCRCPIGHAVKSLNNATCIKVYGSSCADIHMCGYTESFFYRRSYFEILYKYHDYYSNKHFHCDLDNVCSCKPGFRWNQQIHNCEQIYDSICNSDMDCYSDNQSSAISTRMHICNIQTQKCDCRLGFRLSSFNTFDENQHVTRFICEGAETWYCESDEDCSASRVNSTCNSGSMCNCAEGLIEHGGACMLKESVCPEVVLTLPDLYRRSPKYALSSTEPPIRDDRLKDIWYNIGPAMISTEVKLNGRLPGACGTYYPIYLAESITAMEQSEIDSGYTITKQAKIGGLHEFGTSNNLSVQIRKCGSQYLAKLQVPNVVFAAYCLEHDTVSVSAGNSTDRWAHLEQKLQFQSEIDDNTSTEIYKPSVVFRCHPLDKYYNSYYYNYGGHCSGCNRYSYSTDGWFYTIHWYVNGLQCKTIGPTERSRLQETDLTESYISNMCGHRHFGFQIQCSFQWSETMFGERSTPIFSKRIQTGLNAWTVVTSAAGDFILPSIHSTPIGCQSSASDTSETCRIKWNLSAHGSCPFHTTKDIPDLCGVSILGLTKYGWERHYSQQYAFWRILFNETYIAELQANTLLTNGLKILISSDVKLQSSNMIATFAPLTSDHELWNGYTIPNIRVITKQTSSDTKETIRIIYDHGVYTSVISKETLSGNKIVFPMKEVGEFLVFKSRKHVVEVHVQTEVCSKGACACGIIIRNGNEIYMNSICNGITRDGFIHIGHG
ncbi:hypothetical protein DPMN_064969 [Dreissena polymorpha]|uniref:EGF-like domain-containing protein n=1 Tax=Dreissena polymorpha TaxID=45954 RepID=A0A9D4CDP9_DREPO|nr:hypothetical protein DPMN_064969 [Dreissena polymorpha]